MTGKVLVPPKEYHTQMELDAFFYREALLALEQNFDVANVLAMSPLSQEVYWRLKNKKEV